jgi:hypothetical protein
MNNFNIIGNSENIHNLKKSNHKRKKFNNIYHTANSKSF